MKTVHYLNLNSTSAAVANVIDKIMEKGGKTLYNSYIKPKLMPFTSKAII